MLLVSWIAHTTNDCIINKIKMLTRYVVIFQTILILHYFAHVIRRQHLRRKRGKRSKGRSPKRWIDQAGKITDCKIHLVEKPLWCGERYRKVENCTSHELRLAVQTRKESENLSKGSTSITSNISTEECACLLYPFKSKSDYKWLPFNF